MLQNFYEPGERASSEPSIFIFSSASGDRVCDLWLINERAKPLARSAHATISSWPAQLIANPDDDISRELGIPRYTVSKFLKHIKIRHSPYNLLHSGRPRKMPNTFDR